MEIVNIEKEFSHVDPKYCDYNSTSPLPLSLISKAEDVYRRHWANPSSTHSLGGESKDIVERAHRAILRLIGTADFQATFCGSATEAANLAIKSLLRTLSNDDVIIISKVEHSCLLSDQRRNEWTNATVHELALTEKGVVSLGALKEYVTTYGKRLKAIVCQAVNNETGVIEPIQEIREIIGDRLLLVDCSQAVGKAHHWRATLRLADYAVMSPHKYYGPKGIGILLSRKKERIEPLYFGGGQEKGARPGTENVPVMALLQQWIEFIAFLEKMNDRVGSIREHFECEISRLIPDSRILGSGVQRISNTSAIYLPGIDAEAVMFGLDRQGYSIATGSACHSGAPEPSHVFLAHGLSWEEAKCVIRVSFGLGNEKEGGSTLAIDLAEVIGRMKQI